MVNFLDYDRENDGPPRRPPDWVVKRVREAVRPFFFLHDSHGSATTQHATRNERLSESFLRWEAMYGTSVGDDGSDDDDGGGEYDSDEASPRR